MRRRERAARIDVEPRLGSLVGYLDQLDGLTAAWIYGSYGTPHQTPLSDLDLALLYRPDRLPAAGEEWRVEQRVAALLGEDDVSVLVLNRAPVLLQFRVLAEGRRLLCLDPEAQADFLERILGEHADYVFVHDRFAEEYDRALAGRQP